MNETARVYPQNTVLTCLMSEILKRDYFDWEDTSGGEAQECLRFICANKFLIEQLWAQEEVEE